MALIKPIVVAALCLILAAVASAQETTWNALNRQILKLIKEQKHAEGVEVATKALAIAEKTFGPDHPDTALSLKALAFFYERQGKYTEAEPLYRRSLQIKEKALGEDHRRVANALNSLAVLLKRQTRFSEAEPLDRRCLAIREMALGTEHPDVAQSLNDLAVDCQYQGKYSEAEPLFRRSLAILEKALGKDNPRVAASLNNLAQLYTSQGKYADAEALSKRSLAIRETALGMHHPAVAGSLNNLAWLYKSQGKYTEAEALYKRSVAILENAHGKDHVSVAGTVNDLGHLYQERGDYAQALSQYEKSLAIFKAAGLRESIEATQNLMADLHLDAGDIPGADAIIREVGYPALKAKSCLLRKRFDLAKEYYELMRRQNEETRNADGRFVAYTGLGMAYEGLGNDLRAAEYYRKAVDLTEDLRSSLKRGDRERFFDARIWGFTRTTPYEGLVRVLLRMNKPLEAFKSSEYCKARVFAERISARTETARFDISADVLREDQGIQDRLTALKQAGEAAYKQKDQARIEALEPQIAQLEEQFKEHVKMLRTKYPLFAAVKYPLPMDLAQTALKPDEWALEYDVTDAGVAVFLTKGTDLKKALFKAIDRKELDSLVRSFRSPVVAGPEGMTYARLVDFDFAAGKRLADVLLGDALSDLPPGTPVIVVPDDCLGVLPFEMLVLNTSGEVKTDKAVPYVVGAEFFADRNPISYYQSITALTLARTLGKRQKPGEKLLAMVDPVFGSEDPRLVKIEKEKRERLVATLPKDLLRSMAMDNGLEWVRLDSTARLGRTLKDADPAHTDLYEGIDAKKSILLEKDLTPYRSMVFATHGHYGRALAGIQEPVLVLTLVDQPEGQDGFLRLSEVMGLRMNCDVAALAACQSGLGKQISGEGTMGMGRAFQYAGARSVLMSLWSVEDESSVMLMERFFKHLRQGKNKLDALKLARNEVRTAGFDHPFFWAPFILVGEVD